MTFGVYEGLVARCYYFEDGSYPLWAATGTIHFGKAGIPGGFFFCPEPRAQEEVEKWTRRGIDRRETRLETGWRCLEIQEERGEVRDQALVELAVLLREKGIEVFFYRGDYFGVPEKAWLLVLGGQLDTTCGILTEAGYISL